MMTTYSRTRMGHNFLLLFVSILSSTSWAYEWDCNLHCFNEGKCRLGKGKFGSFAGMDEETSDMLPFAERHHVGGMYCACPVGWTGLQCEIKVHVCGEDGVDQHTCFNGAECARDKTTNGKVFFRCECDAIQSDMTASYAGKYCEHISTTFCNHRKGSSSLVDTSSFCTNGGRCKELTETHSHFAGCVCPDGWEGTHCEFRSAMFVEEQNKKTRAKHFKLLIILLSVVGALVAIGVGVHYYLRKQKKRRQKKRRRRQKEEEENGYKDNPSTMDESGNPRDII